MINNFDNNLEGVYNIVNSITPFDESLYKKIKNNFDNLAKPIDGLGDFEWILSRIGAIEKKEKIELNKAALVIFISDNGIIEEGVSQSQCDVTYEVAKALGRGKSTVCHMAKQSGIEVVPVNVGIKMASEIDGVINESVARGTNNFLKEPAMSKNELVNAFMAGYRTTEDLAKRGVKVLLLGEMGIGNTTTSAAVTALLKKLKGADVTSRGAGLSDAGLIKKTAVIDKATELYFVNKTDASAEGDRLPSVDRNEFMETLEILRCVGGFDIVALTGAIFSACKNSIAVISDGFVTGTAALAAKRLNLRVADYVIFSHNGREQGMRHIFNEFPSKPVISADMALGEGTGACIFYSALKTACAVYHGGTHFSDINIDNYERL